MGLEQRSFFDETDIQDPRKQVENVACLPRIVGYSITMPDMHWGYGLPIGGIAAMDAEEGVISPEGYGVRHQLWCASCFSAPSL